MSPLDDELRTTLRSRAGAVHPTPDPLAGIEARAGRLRRRRTALAATGTALAVAAVVLVVPTVLDRDSGRGAAPTQFATTSSGGTLDPAQPWSFRGTLSDAARADFARAWQSRHPGSTLTALFGQTYEPSGQEEAVFIASGPDGDRWGFVQNATTGPDFVKDEAYGTHRGALSVEQPGDEGVSRLIVVAAPDSSIGSEQATFAPLAPGVGITPVEQAIHWTVTSSDGRQVAQGDTEPASSSARPRNLLRWEARGGNELPLVPGMRTSFAPALNTTPERVNYKVLFAGETAGGVRYLVGQIWASTDREVHSFAYAEGGTNGPEVFLGPLTPIDPSVLAFVLGSQPGSTTDLLVVVPAPGAGQVSYDADATGPFTPVTGQDQLNGVVLLDRDPRATADRLQVLDGNGNLDQPMFEGPVAPLLCGAKECG